MLLSNTAEIFLGDGRALNVAGPENLPSFRTVPLSTGLSENNLQLQINFLAFQSPRGPGAPRPRGLVGRCTSSRPLNPPLFVILMLCTLFLVNGPKGFFSRCAVLGPHESAVDSRVVQLQMQVCV